MTGNRVIGSSEEKAADFSRRNPTGSEKCSAVRSKGKRADIPDRLVRQELSGKIPPVHQQLDRMIGGVYREPLTGGRKSGIGYLAGGQKWDHLLDSARIPEPQAVIPADGQQGSSIDGGFQPAYFA